MKTNAERGRANRRKGQGGEREFAQFLGGLIERELTRNLGQERDGGHDISVPMPCGPDLCIEVKRRAKPITHGQVAEWLNGMAAERPAVAYRSDRQRWRVAMHARIHAPHLQSRDESLRMVSVMVDLSIHDFAQWITG